MYPSEKQRIRDITELAAKAFAQHRIIQNLAQGLHRHWSCVGRRGSAYHFNVITEPGRLIVTGDIGEIILCRLPDMIEFLRTSLGDLDYLAGKVQGKSPREWSEDLCKDWLAARVAEVKAEQRQDAEDYALDGAVPAHVAMKRNEKLEKYRQLYQELEDGRIFFELALYRSGLADGDWPRLETFSHQFLWCTMALRWFMANLDKVPVRYEG
jgi:hypothetical protein